LSGIFDSVAVDVRKLVDYCLSETHPRGRHKARVFRARLGLMADDAAVVRRALLDAAQDPRSALRETAADRYGRRYVLDLAITGPAGTATVRSAWIVRTGETVLRFLSCYVL
jgi:hypothetical protein